MQTKSLSKRVASSLLELLFPRPITTEELNRLPHSCGTGITNTHVLFTYQDKRVQKLIRYLKNNPDQTIANAVAIQLAHVFRKKVKDGFLSQDSIDPIVMAMPSTPERKRRYGFNQITPIARAFSKHTGFELIPEYAVVAKSKKKKQALVVGKRARRENVQGMFVVRQKQYLKGKVCIVIDDLITTGATYDELKHSLRQAQALHVICLAIAH